MEEFNGRVKSRSERKIDQLLTRNLGKSSSSSSQVEISLKKDMIGFEFQWMANSFSHVQASLVLFTDEGRSAICHLPSASSRPASSARWFPPWSPCGCRAAWRVGSQGRRGRPAKPLTPLSAAPLSTWGDEKYDFKGVPERNIRSIFLAFFSPLSFA